MFLASLEPVAAGSCCGSRVHVCASVQDSDESSQDLNTQVYMLPCSFPLHWVRPLELAEVNECLCRLSNDIFHVFFCYTTTVVFFNRSSVCFFWMPQPREAFVRGNPQQTTTDCTWKTTAVATRSASGTKLLHWISTFTTGVQWSFFAGRLLSTNPPRNRQTSNVIELYSCAASQPRAGNVLYRTFISLFIKENNKTATAH